MKFDKAQIAKSFSQAAANYEQAACLQQLTRGVLYKQLTQLQLKPQRLIDLGSGSSAWSNLLQRQFPQAHLLAIDIAFGMLAYAKRHNCQWSYLCADAEHLPLAAQSVDVIVSNMLLHWCSDLTAACQEWRRALKPNGYLVFATLGQDTLRELRQSWLHVDNQPHVHDFINLKKLQTALRKCGFSHLQLIQKTIIFNYANVQQLMQELKTTGVHNLHPNRQRGLSGKQALTAMRQAYEQYRSSKGLPASYQVIYGICR